MTADRTRVAYHEAGHAVCAILLGERFDSVTIKPSGEVDGRVEGFLGWLEDRGGAVRTAMVRFAGPLAEAFMTPGLASSLAKTDAGDPASAVGAHNDWADAEDALSALWEGRGAFARRYVRTMRRTGALLRSEENLARIGKLAGALLERESLTFYEALEVCESDDNVLERFGLVRAYDAEGEK